MFSCQKIFSSADMKRHHKLKLYLFLTAMREYKDELEDSGISVHYSKLNDRDEK
jgi:deoxyribodipyrimidine photolyase-like uncharacterized protein